jgi:two-component system alkaline phosphatase synthesis response regulator PhoP
MEPDPAPPPSGPAATTRILIAEDEPSIVVSLEFLLKGAGYEVMTARDGGEALRAAEELKPDLMVLDIMLPVVNGFDVCRRIRESPVLRHILILLLTARGRESEIARGLALGANAYMTKPFATRELMKTVADLLAGRTAGGDPPVSQ